MRATKDAARAALFLGALGGMPATWVQLVRANVLLGCCSLENPVVSYLAL